ncbi:MAG: 50S ribosomal protein L10 [Candidatus Yanofskybacteria bacterium RIFCSPHIGHO2_01_FULL_45_42]|uniref:Large ribosomal subunit protein uL10 n=3 Tax=Candidatus Yanofskyibacteriota TaxID=1752733 RepID=A0A1F8EZR5_9BACT|nr:MAG: 50S ribosomal protein L10 [Candidatus Yanofskybacteria bacterium RIFCSPHIGHO2_01_FULL_45_42]
MFLVLVDVCGKYAVFYCKNMKSKQQKIQELTGLKAKMPKASITIFTTFSRAGEKGLSVAQMQELKRALRGIESEYLVTKKTLIDKALKAGKYDGVDIYGVSGSVGLVVGQGDAYSVSKKVYEFAKKNPVLQFFGAIFEGKFVDGIKFKEMAMMPSREMLLGRLLGMMKYPLTAMAIVLRQISEKQSSSIQ